MCGFKRDINFEGTTRNLIEDTYWYIDQGDIESHREQYDDIDDYLFKNGNYYLCKEDAKKALIRQETLVKLQNLAFKLNDYDIINWCADGVKYTIYYNYNKGELKTAPTISNAKTMEGIYCKDKDFLKMAIKEIGEEALLSYFGTKPKNRVISLDGKDLIISEESYQAFKEQFKGEE